MVSLRGAQLLNLGVSQERNIQECATPPDIRLTSLHMAWVETSVMLHPGQALACVSTSSDNTETRKPGFTNVN